MIKKKYKVIIKAGDKKPTDEHYEYLLLGGVRSTESIWFNTRKEAKDFMDVSVDINRKAGRRVGEHRIVSKEIKR